MQGNITELRLLKYMNNDHKFIDLEYFLSFDHIVYLVKGYYHPQNSVLAYPVFWPDENGDRVHPIFGRFIKNVSDFNEKIFTIHPEYQHADIPSNTPLIPRNHVIEVFQPKERVPEFLEQEKNTVWHNIFMYLTTSLDIPKDDIGIFGSYLVGLHKNAMGSQIKDIDFVIYGLENLFKVREGIERLLQHFGFTHISNEHIRYHMQKFGILFDPSINSFDKTSANKWSSIQIKPGLLATLRFVYKLEEVPPNPITSDISKLIQIEGVVEDDIGTNFMPRVFTIHAAGSLYTIVNYFWAFQSCVKKGDQCLITGNLHKDGKVISVDAASHGIKIV